MAAKTAKKPEKEQGLGRGRGDNGPGKCKIPLSSAEQDTLRRAAKARRKPAPAKGSGQNREAAAASTPKKAEARIPTPQKQDQRELATQLWNEFKSWLLANPEADFHVRSASEMDAATRHLQCFFYPGQYPSGLSDKTVAELWSVFVTFCIENNVPYGTLPGQQFESYRKERKIQQLRIFREKAVQQVEDDIKEKEMKRARFAGKFINFAIRRLEGDPALDEDGRKIGVAYFQALLSGYEPDLEIESKTLSRIRFNLALSCAIKSVRDDFYPFQSLDWFAKKSDEARRVLQPRSA